MTRLPNSLQLLRLRAGLSQSEVATAIDRSTSTVSRIESGEYGIDPWVRQLAELYGCSDEDVLEAADSPARGTPGS